MRRISIRMPSFIPIAGRGSVAVAVSGCAVPAAGGVTGATGAAAAGAGAAVIWPGAGRSKRSMAISEGCVETRSAIAGPIAAPPPATAPADRVAVVCTAVLSALPAPEMAMQAPIRMPTAHTAKP